MERRTVRDVMTKAVVSAYEGATFKDIVKIMTDRGLSALPVVGEGHRVIGLVSEADLLATAEHLDRGSQSRDHALTAGRLMSVPPITIGPGATVTEAARTLYRCGVKRLPVVDERGYLLGIVSRRDLLRVFTRRDDEIRAEVYEDIGAGLLRTDRETISVRVEKGVVTLTGRVTEQRMIPTAVRLAAAIDGVVDVIDRLTVPAGA
jgi:CBS-domain-containing membrane protein